MVSARFPNRPFDLRENFWLIRQDVASNASLVGWELWIDKVSYSPTRSSARSYQDMRIDGNLVNSAGWNGYDFTGNGPWQILRGENWVGHNGDGTKTFSINGHGNFDILGAVNVYSNFTLPTIPRTSTLSWQNGNWVEAGQTIGWNINRSADFTHDSDYYFGNTSGRASTGATTAGAWTVPMELLNQIPNTTSGIGTLRMHTMSGGTLIGYGDYSIGITVPGWVVPQITGEVAAVEATPGVSAAVGKFVQNVSRLDISVGAVNGQYGASIPSNGVRMDLRKGAAVLTSLPTSSGRTPVVTESGTLTALAIATDSRGRWTTKGLDVEVLPYTPPSVTTYSLNRFKDPAGTISDPEAGEYVKITLNAAVQSLMNTTQRNSISIALSTRKSGETAWVGRRAPATSGIVHNTAFMIQRELAVTTRVRNASNVATITTSTSHNLAIGDVVAISGVNNTAFNGTFTVTAVPSTTTFSFSAGSGGSIPSASSTGLILTSVRFPAVEAHDVRVQVSDLFNSVGAQTTLSVGAIFMHWAAGLGVGKFYERGKLDVGGDIYLDNVPVFAGPVKALLDPAYMGPGPAKVSFDFGTTYSSVAYKWMGQGYKPNGNRTVDMVRQGGTWMIMGHTADEGYGGAVRIDLDETKVKSYTFVTADSLWAEPATVRRLPSGIVQLDGMIGINRPNATPQGVIATIPPLYRPDTDMIVPVDVGDQRRSLTIKANGNIEARANWTTNVSYVSISNIAYPAAGVATWTPIGSAGSAWKNNWNAWPDNPTVYGTPSFWRDSYGMVWYRGLISGGTTGTDNLPMFTVPAGYENPKLTTTNGQSHQIVVSQDDFGFISAITDSSGVGSIAYKNGTTGNQWISLAGMHTQTATSLAQPGWTYPTMANGWGDYSPSEFPRFSIWRRPDGLVVSRGLIRAGTVGARLANLERPYRSGYGRRLFATVSAGGRGRIDISGETMSGAPGAAAGEIYISQGSTSWVSFDGMSWILGD